MRKDWLIRTYQNQILGPVSRKKIIEFLQKGGLNPQDEICQGNGFWFWVREEKLLNTHIYEGVDQPFNPMSVTESKSQSEQDTADRKGRIEDGDNENQQKLPNDDDLEFPK